MLVSNPINEDEWPSELIQLRDRFTEKYETQLSEIKLQHEKEIAELKEEHLKKLNSALERARKRSSKDNESLDTTELEIIKER